MTTSTKTISIYAVFRILLVALISLVFLFTMVGCSKNTKPAKRKSNVSTKQDVMEEDTLFEDTKAEVLKIVGTITGKDDYFYVDTYPNEYKNMEPAYVALIKDDHREKVLEAVIYANEAFGFDSSIYTSMINTTAEMGEQSVENEKYKISWNNSSDDGLKVTYYKK